MARLLVTKCRNTYIYLSVFMRDFESRDFCRTNSLTMSQSQGFHNWITADGSSEYKAEKGRYHLYISYACPFAHRALIARQLKGLEDVISLSVVDILKFDKGWRFNEKTPLCTNDPVFGAEYLRDIYMQVQPDYTGRITVPLLVDKKTKTIVNNESAEILRIFNKEFNEFCSTKEQRNIDLRPESLQSKIDEVNDWIAPNINLGVYHAGFATQQEIYDRAVDVLFEHLDKAEKILSGNRYLAGNQLTEADVRLFTTLVRFDLVYHFHFKCNKKRIVDYPNLWEYARDLYQTHGFDKTIQFDHITKHYYMSHLHVNPSGIVPVGLASINFEEKQDRATRFK